MGVTPFAETNALLAIIRSDEDEALQILAERLASGVTCQPGQPAACGDYHNAGQCVRPRDDAADNPAALHGGQPDTPAPTAEPATDIYGRPCTVYMAPEGCTDPYRCRVHRGAYPAPAPTRSGEEER